MRRTVALALLICLLVAGDCLGQVIDTSDHSIWLKENAVAIRSIDPEDEDFSDLEPLKQLIGDARIVGLGEQTHGDGATFHAKTRLIKFLHQEMGFDVLVWESGMYDCRLVDRALRFNQSLNTAWREGIFGVWGMSEQVQPLFEYVDVTRKTDRPLEIAGMDAQITGTNTVDVLGRHLEGLLQRAGTTEALAKSFADVNSILEKMKARPPVISRKDWETMSDAAGTICDELDKADGSFASAAQPRERSLLGRSLRNFVAAVEMAHWMGRVQAEPAEARQHQRKVAMTREPAMSQTLLWLGSDYFADRKLIVWAASSHLTYNPRTVELRSRDGSFEFDNAPWTPMGHAVHQALGADFYVIDFIAYSGEIGSVAGWSRELDPAEDGSLDAICHETGEPYLFVDLRTLPEKQGGQWLRDRMIARPRGYAPMRADWSNVCDAFVFTDRMYPSTANRTGSK